MFKGCSFYSHQAFLIFLILFIVYIHTHAYVNGIQRDNSVDCHLFKYFLLFAVIYTALQLSQCYLILLNLSHPAVIN